MTGIIFYGFLAALMMMIACLADGNRFFGWLENGKARMLSRKRSGKNTIAWSVDQSSREKENMTYMPNRSHTARWTDECKRTGAETKTDVFTKRGSSREKLLFVSIFWILWLIMTAVAALRIDVGNDYGNYVTTFHEIYVGGYVVTEPGFNWFVRLIYTLCGGEEFLVIFALFAAVTAYLFLKAMMDQSVDFSMSFALFMLFGLYFRTFNTVRYYFVLAVTLYSLRFVLKKEFGKFLVLIGLAATFHKSVLVVIPLYFIALLPWKKWMVALGAAAAISLPLFQDFWMQILLKLYPSYQNTVYLEQEVGLEGSLLGILRCAAVLLLALAAWKEAMEDQPTNLFYWKLNLLALALYACASFIPLVSRLGYYLITPHVLLIPGILKRLPSGKKKTLLTAAVWGLAILYFAYFLLTAHQMGVRVLPYHTWIFMEKEWLDGSVIF